MTSPVVVSRIQNRRGTQAQFDALYPPGYNGTGGLGTMGPVFITTSASGNGTTATLILASLTSTYSYSNTIATFGTLVPGSGYLYNVYDNVPLTGGTGTGARATITVDGATNVSIVTITNAGTGYTLGDVLSTLPSNLGSAGSSVTFTGGIASIGTITPGGSYLPNIYENVPLTGGTGTGARANININGAGSVGAVINDPAVLITDPGTGYTAGDVLSATTATGVFSTTGLGSGFDVVVATVTNATVSAGPIATFAVIAASVGPGWTGLNYLPGTYTAVPLVGGHGVGATATVIVDGATNVSTITLVGPGTGYIVGDELSVLPADLGIPVNPSGSGLQAGGFVVPVLTISGAGGGGFSVTVSTLQASGTFPAGSVASLGAVIPGLNYLPGTYTNVPLVGGHGAGAMATVVVNGSTNVSSVVLTTAGVGYAPGDVLIVNPASLGVFVNPSGAGLHAAGFSVTVSTISLVPGPTYPIGSQIIVGGVTPLGYNGTYTVTGSSPGSVSYASSTTGAQTISGTVTQPYSLSNFPNILMPGELALCTDTRRVFIGNLNGEYIELEMTVAGGANMSFMPTSWVLPPVGSFTPISKVLPGPFTVYLEYSSTPFLTVVYDVTDSLSPDWNSVGVNFSRSGELRITAVADFTPIPNPPFPDITAVSLTDVASEVNRYAPAPPLPGPQPTIQFIAQYNGPKIEILYQHNFPGNLTFTTGTLNWMPI